MSSKSPDSSPESRHLNRLSKAKSPYLLQHSHNPVDWYEWGNEAFEKAKKEDKPIFLSVGYSACHWCHVLAHESFEDDVTAKLMNDYYINIKVDREERPDVDQLYMTFLQASSGGGGWPMSVWLTPELHPFLAGTYFPPGQFRQVLTKLADVWESDRERIVASGKRIIEQLRETSNLSPDSNPLSIPEITSTVYDRLQKLFDPTHGGFGRAPKFPSPSQTLHFLARYAAFNLQGKDNEKAEKARDMAVETMVKIYNGGIRDVVGGGFSRYSVDERWHVPHFEKMLYDEAQLLISSLELSQLLPSTSPQRETLQSMAADIITYVSRDLKNPEGAFYSAEDADSLPSKDSTVKKEGAFYAWTAQDLDQILGEDSNIFKFHHGVEENGNCDPRHDIQGELKGQNVLFTAHRIEETATEFNRQPDDIRRVLDRSIAKLKDYRDHERPRPHLDDKILTGWNGLMISGLSKASEFLDDNCDLSSKALQLAEESASFIRTNLYDETTGELRRSYREGPGPTGQADDYAFLIQGLLDLYEASGKETFIQWAIRLQEKQNELFYDKEGGGYFTSAPDEHILVRMKEAQDGAEPCASSITLYNLQRLSHFAEDRYKEYQEKADSILKANSQILNASPGALATMVAAAMVGERGCKQFIVTGQPATSENTSLLDAIRRQFIPNRVLIHLDPSHPPNELAKVNGTLRSLVEGIQSGKDVKPNVRICENFTCGLPIYTPEELKMKLSK